MSARYAWRDDLRRPFQSIWSLAQDFAVLNIVQPKELYKIFRAKTSGRRRKPDSEGKLCSASFFEAIGIPPAAGEEHLDRFYFPPESKPAVVADDVRFCVECLADGYHSPFFQILAVDRCPVHKTELHAWCIHCGARIGFEFGVEAHTCRCGRHYRSVGRPKTAVDYKPMAEAIDQLRRFNVRYGLLSKTFVSPPPRPSDAASLKCVASEIRALWRPLVDHNDAGLLRSSLFGGNWGGSVPRAKTVTLRCSNAAPLDATQISHLPALYKSARAIRWKALSAEAKNSALVSYGNRFLGRRDQTKWFDVAAMDARAHVAWRIFWEGRPGCASDLFWRRRYGIGLEAVIAERIFGMFAPFSGFYRNTPGPVAVRMILPILLDQTYEQLRAREEAAARSGVEIKTFWNGAFSFSLAFVDAGESIMRLSSL